MEDAQGAERRSSDIFYLFPPVPCGPPPVVCVRVKCVQRGGLCERVKGGRWRLCVCLCVCVCVWCVSLHLSFLHLFAHFLRAGVCCVCLVWNNSCILTGACVCVCVCVCVCGVALLFMSR